MDILQMWKLEGKGGGWGGSDVFIQESENKPT